MTDYTYTATVMTGSGMFLTGRKLFDETISGVVIRSGGVQVWRGSSWRHNDHARKRAQLEANNCVGRFRAYLKDNGRCWYDDNQKERRDEQLRREVARSRQAALAEFADELFSALKLGEDLDDTERTSLIEQVQDKIDERVAAKAKRLEKEWQRGDENIAEAARKRLAKMEATKG